ncbi:tail fiber domain-containing protein [Uliginosibacterium sediminicola]|uniref:Tail fiber domain-containing protein n=2 Tax=Uliginosibacterium sediminicola TaxID=2024550 RepID=A0ABU9YW46_9RHOO
MNIAGIATLLRSAYGFLVAKKDPDTGEIQINNPKTGQPLSPQDLGWQTGGDMLASNALSEITNAVAARVNLGLGDAATRNVGAGPGTVTAGDDPRLSDARPPTAHTHADKADLVGGKVPAIQLPSYMDDVIEAPSAADFPQPGESGKIYVAINGGEDPANPTKQYRWSGSGYVLIPSSPGSTDDVVEGANNLYFRAQRVLGVALSGLSAVVAGAIDATDTVLVALAKLQAQINNKAAAQHTHKAADIDDASAVGRAVLTAADKPAARAAVDLQNHERLAVDADGNVVVPGAGEFHGLSSVGLLPLSARDNRVATTGWAQSRPFDLVVGYDDKDKHMYMGRLPVSTAGTFDRMVLDGIWGQWTIVSSPFVVVMTNRGELQVKAQSSSAVAPVRAYLQPDGSVDVYLYLGLSFCSVMANRFFSSQVFPSAGELVDPAQITGTLVWDGMLSSNVNQHTYFAKNLSASDDVLVSAGQVPKPSDVSHVRVKQATIWANGGSVGILSSMRHDSSYNAVKLGAAWQPAGQLFFNLSGTAEWIISGKNGGDDDGSVLWVNNIEDMLSAGVLFAKFGYAQNELYKPTACADIYPSNDTGANCGRPAQRWNTVFTGSVITTSDARVKTDPRSVTADEIAAAIDLVGNVGIYQYLDAVAKKGADAARLHVGMTVQSAIAIMESHGLDPLRYGFICYDAWGAEYTEVEDASGDIVRPVERQATRTEQQPYSEIQIIDGVPVRKSGVRDVQVPITELRPVVDESGSPVLDDADNPLMHPVPLMETVDVRYRRVETRSAGELYSFRETQLALFIARGLFALHSV